MIISKEEIEDIMKTVTSLKESGLLVKGASETNENEAKEQIGRFLGILLGTLDTSLLGSMLVSKSVIRGDKGTIRARQYF